VSHIARSPYTTGGEELTRQPSGGSPMLMAVLAETAKPTQDYFVVVATILPIAFLAGVVELRFSLTSRSEPTQARGFRLVDPSDTLTRSLALLAMTLSTIAGEWACLNALWNGRSVGEDGFIAAFCLGVDGFILAMIPVRRSSADLKLSPWARRWFSLVLNGLIVLCIVAILVILIVNKFT
jgi:hypothetical protein